MLAVGEALVARGHTVTVLSQPSVGERASAAGCEFRAFSAVPDYDRRTLLEEQIDVAVPALTGKTVGDDLVATARDADGVVVDANLAGALAAAECLDVPSAVLLHSMYATFVDTWFAEIWPALDPLINATRHAYGLPRTDSWPAAFAAHDRLIAVVPTVFEAPTTAPPTTMRHYGFLVPGARTTETDYPPGDGPAVLVGLSTTFQRHDDLLRNIVDDLATLPVRAVVTTAGHGTGIAAPSNVAVAEFAPHAALLAHADLMVTHAGLGSVAAALSAGVPLVCVPLGRDQHLNAERVTDLGAGVIADEHTLAAAISDVLGDTAFRTAAESLARVSREEGGPAAAAADLETLCG